MERITMEPMTIDRGWRFRWTANGQTRNQSNEWRSVDLPHDFSIIQARDPQAAGGAANGFFPGGVAHYEKAIEIPEEWAGHRIVVEFEGVYMNATVRMNRNFVRFHPYGYTSFFCDLTRHVRFGGENTLLVTVNNSAMPNSRWYSGSGIYRHVRLHVLPELHIAPWGIAVTTPKVSTDESTVEVTTTVEDHRNGGSPKSARVRSMLRDAAGESVATDESDLEAGVGRARLSVSNARLWSIDDPYLYTLESELLVDGRPIDRRETHVGIRSISFDRDAGFELNGVGMKLKGGCVHHDCGLLGSAAYDRAEERKIELLKESGFNAVRTAHNPPSTAFLDACDRLGMLVIDEAFDCWRDGKNPNDYSVAFEAHWKADIDAMVLRDRNHPSIIMWSTGNEIIERDGRSDGYEYARLLADRVRSLDPTRAITNALCGLWEDPDASGLAANVAAPTGDGERDYWGELTERFAEPLDVVGYNYLLHRYEGDGQRFPKRIICGEETFPKDVYDYWEATERLPYVIGDFVWTAIDYLGEAGIGHVWYNGETTFLGDYPWNQAYCGDIDICGFKRPQSYYRDCVWGIATAPYIAVQDPHFYGLDGVVSRWGWPDVVSSWSWPGFEGNPIVIDVYSRDDEVELVLNGKSLGRRPAGQKHRYTATFETTYAAGDLVAIGYSDGIERSRTELRTAGPVAAIRLTPDRRTLRSEYGDLCFVTVELVDADGSVVHCASDRVHISASGAGTLIAVGNGDPKSDEAYVGTTRRVHNGRAMAVVRTDGEPGEITIAGVCDGVAPAVVTVSAESGATS